jgi:hypothetical protein
MMRQASALSAVNIAEGREGYPDEYGDRSGGLREKRRVHVDRTVGGDSHHRPDRRLGAAGYPWRISSAAVDDDVGRCPFHRADDRRHRKRSAACMAQPTSVWPLHHTQNVASNNQFASSTEFFRYAVTNNIFEVDVSFFYAPGLLKGRNPATFSATNNAWCIVGNITESYPATAPAVFSRNLGGGSLSFERMDDPLEGDPARRGVVRQLAGHPFEDRAFVFATKGSAGYALMKENLRFNDFTNLFQRLDRDGVILTNQVLRP